MGVFPWEIFAWNNEEKNSTFPLCGGHFNSSPLSAAYASVKEVNIGSGNGLSPLWRQSITRTNAGLLSFGLLGTNFNEIQTRILSFSFKKIHLKLSSAKMAAILSRGRWVDDMVGNVASSPLPEWPLILSCTWLVYRYVMIVHLYAFYYNLNDVSAIQLISYAILKM